MESNLFPAVLLPLALALGMLGMGQMPDARGCPAHPAPDWLILQLLAVAPPIAAGLLGDLEMAVPAAFDRPWMYGSGLVMVGCGRRAR